jgi:hypothetical protein
VKRGFLVTMSNPVSLSGVLTDVLLSAASSWGLLYRAYPLFVALGEPILGRSVAAGGGLFNLRYGLGFVGGTEHSLRIHQSQIESPLGVSRLAPISNPYAACA